MFTLRFRFRLPPERVIIADNDSHAVGSLEFSLDPEPDLPGSYAVKVRGFASEADASAHVDNLRVALAWLLLQEHMAAEASFDVQDFRHAPGGLPVPIDGTRPAVYPTDTRLSVVTGFPGTIQQGVPARVALGLIVEAVQFPHVGRLADDDRLVLALDLYRDHFTESSANAKFLTLIMALEALASGDANFRESDIARGFIDSWREEVAQRKMHFVKDSEEERSLASLDGSLSHRRNGSKGNRIRYLVYSTLHEAGSPDAKTCAKLASDLYVERSNLLHSGRLGNPKAIGAYIANAGDIVLRVLRARFRAVVR